MLVNFSDDIRQPWSTGFISQQYNTAEQNVVGFYRESTWGQVSVSADVFGWLPIAETTTSCSLNAISSQADAAATASGVNLATYTNRAYIFPYNDGCHIAGTGEQPGTRVWIGLTPEGCVEATGACQSRHLFSHEFGHNFGLDHANLLRCTDALGNLVTLSNTCTVVARGDGFSVMGCCNNTLFSNLQRLQMGWIPPSQVVTVTQTSTLTITPADTASSLIYRIPDGTGKYLYLENRARAATPYELNYPTGWPNGALLFRRAPDFTTIAPTEILIGGPNTPGHPVALAVGDGFTMPSGTTMTNLGFDGVNNTVLVEVP